MGYLYRHIRLDKNEVFYIGISIKNDNYARAYEKTRRNKHWKNIVSKTDYEVEIMLDDLTIEEAKLKEIEFISLYGRKDLGKGTLVNMTNGGDGNNGISKHKRKEMSEHMIKMWKKEDYREKCIKSRNTEEYKKNMRNSVLDIKILYCDKVVLDVETGIFYTIRELSRLLNIANTTLKRHLHKNINKKYKLV